MVVWQCNVSHCREILVQFNQCIDQQQRSECEMPSTPSCCFPGVRSCEIQCSFFSVVRSRGERVKRATKESGMWHDLQLPLLNTHDIHFTRVLLNADRSRSSTPATITCLHITHYTLHITRYTCGTHQHQVYRYLHFLHIM